MKFIKKIFRLKNLLIICIVSILLFLGNNILTVTTYNIKNDKIPEEFSDFKIVQISDLHNGSFGKNNRRLIDKIKKIEPTIIVVTGDVIDSRRTNIAVAKDFLEQAKDIAPTYYITGNHEIRVYKEYLELEDAMIAMGVTVLRNDFENIKIGDEEIRLVGIDASVNKNGKFYIPNSEDINLPKILDNLIDKEKFSILLAHRPELYKIYKGSEADLILSGHTHGGQVRIPFVGGIVVPNQEGLFPKYDSGEFLEEGSTLIISRGLGNSLFPFRIFNFPEIVVIELER